MAPTIQLDFDVLDEDLIVYEGNVVMTRAEAPYLERLFRRCAQLRPQRVLEVGFGLGISAGLIQRHLQPVEHVLVEIETRLYERASQFASRLSGVRAVGGDWLAADCGSSFDFVFWDPFDYVPPLCAEAARRETAQRLEELVAPDGVVAHPHFGDGPVQDLPGWRSVVLERFRIEPFTAGDGIECRDVATVVAFRPDTGHRSLSALVGDVSETQTTVATDGHE